MRTDVEQLYHLLHNFHIEIKEEFVFLLVKRADVVLIILEERTLTISREKRIPMHVAPVGMVGNANILHRQRSAVISRNGERKRTIGGRNDHTVAVSLLDKALMALYQAFLIAVQLLIPLHRTEIRGR